MTAVAFQLPAGVLVWQARCNDCGGQFGVMASVPPGDIHPAFCPFCAGRIPYRLASHREVPA